MKTGLSRLAAFLCLVLAVALTSCKKKPKAAPDDLAQGMGYLKAGLHAQAIVALSAHLRRHPTDAEAFANRGVARSAVSDLDGALADFEVALTLNPNSADVHVRRGMLRKGKGDAKGALEDFDDAIELDARYASVYFYRASLRTDAGDLDGAIADYTGALQFEPANALHYFNRGIIRYLRGDWENARKDFETAAKQPQPQPYGLLYAHVLQVRMGKGDAARAELRAAVAKLADPKPGEWFLALAGFLLGDIDEPALLATAGKGSASAVRDQQCEAWYFAGMARLFAGQRAEAADYFRLCVAMGRSHLAEHSFAKAELEPPEARPPPASPPTPAPEPPKPAAPRTLRGRLAVVGKKSISIHDRAMGSIQSVAISQDTKVTLHGAPASAARLMPAMEVEVIVDAKGTARSIIVLGRRPVNP
jgi:lipoprotein NlpI